MFENIDEKLLNIEKSVDRLVAMRDFTKTEMERFFEESSKATYLSELHQKCVEIFKLWLEDALKRNVDSMANLATVGLRNIISDQKLTFRVIQEMKYNRLSMKFVLDEELENGKIITGDPLNSYGGGAAVVVSFILRLVVMTKMNMAKLLLLDESMVALANAYVPSCAAFMRELAEETGVNILMVTHNPEFISHAHISYEGYKDGDSLRLRKTSGDL